MNTRREDRNEINQRRLDMSSQRPVAPGITETPYYTVDIIERSDGGFDVVIIDKHQLLEIRSTNCRRRSNGGLLRITGTAPIANLLRDPKEA